MDPGVLLWYLLKGIYRRGARLKKIGILLESFQVDRYLYDTVSRLAGSDQVDLFFLLNKNGLIKPGFWNRALFAIKTRGLSRFINQSFFRLLALAEHAVLSPFSPKIKEHYKRRDLGEFQVRPVLHLHPIFSPSGLTVRYPRQDIDKIKSLDLDMLIRGNAPGIFKGDILKAAREGIISFHHGDNRWNRGGPPGFWEVYFKKASTGFIVQVLTEELDGGLVLLRANIPTLQSYTENIVNLYHESNPYLAGMVLDYAVHDRLPPPEEKCPFDGPVLREPSVFQSSVYLLCTFWAYVLFATWRYVFHRRLRWSVAFVRKPWREAVLRRGMEIKNPPGRYFADPFIVTREKRTICFVEDCSCREEQGRITAVEILDEKNYNILGPVLEEPFHVSFPYVFEYEGELYMVPETAEAKAIRLYKCVEFPMRWVYLKDIMSHVNAADSMVFKVKDRWWLLSSIGTTGNADRCSTLMAFFSKSPLSDAWKAHEKNPLVFDCATARNGGLLDADVDCPVRVRQRHGFKVYGAEMTLAKISDLTPSTFQEEEIARIRPDFFANIEAAHHMHSNGQYTVYDYAR